jgi:hypothetical protein
LGRHCAIGAPFAGHSLPLPGVLHDARAMAQMILDLL